MGERGSTCQLPLLPTQRVYVHKPVKWELLQGLHFLKRHNALAVLLLLRGWALGNDNKTAAEGTQRKQ